METHPMPWEICRFHLEKVFYWDKTTPSIFIRKTWSNEVIQIHNRQRVKNTSITLFILYFSSITAPRFSLSLWMNDDEALERPGRLGQHITTARPDGAPLGCVGLLVLRDLVVMSCLSCSIWGSYGDMSCISCSSLEELEKIFVYGTCYKWRPT